MTPKTRKEQFDDRAGKVPAFRWRQILTAMFQDGVAGWDDISTLPKALREAVQDIPWMSISLVRLFESKRHDTFKAILKTEDGKLFESVLMFNSKDQWTICVSSQIGCAMRCTFCATGAMGLTRSMTSDEIADQYRFWKTVLADKPKLPQRISNIVFMGMGEPLANYENVKRAIHTWLDNTDIGPTKITVSSVGILTQLNRILDDPDWPPVKIAISLHSANQKNREEIVPTTVPGFLKDLATWSHQYQTILGNKNHHITYEYTLMNEVNDTPEHAEELAKYIGSTSHSKVNVIPLNHVEGKKWQTSKENRIERFKRILRDNGVNVTQRRTMGEDIDAACGQLALSEKENR